jgi:hypothetical protein
MRCTAKPMPVMSGKVDSGNAVEAEAPVGSGDEITVGAAYRHALRAREDGRRLFVYRCNIPASQPGASGPMDAVADAIEEVELAAWRFDQVAFDGHQSGNDTVLLLFRADVTRRPQPYPQ